MICGPNMRGKRREDYLEEDLSKATRLLCDLCTKLEKRGNDELMSEDLKSWWLHHQETDRLNKKAIQQEKTKQQKKKALLKQLTAEERKLLGLEK